jgi:hypothetical protein
MNGTKRPCRPIARLHRVVDSSVFPHCLTIVSRLRQIFAAVLALTAWLGASQHCNLEAAGVFDLHTETDSACCPGSEHGCNTDGCRVVESGSYRLSESKAVVALPSLLECYCYLCHVLVTPPTEATLAEKVRTAVERINPWVPSWHFERRSVAVPGAPALILA